MMRIRLPWSSRLTGLTQLSLILWTIFLLVDSAALPVKTGRSQPSDAPSIAAALDSDHVSFEPKSSSSSNAHSLSTIPSTRLSLRDTTAINTDPLNTDPYKWELCCAPEGTWKCNMALTSSCRGNYRFRCELNGTLTHRKDSDECRKLCGCFEWSENEGKPPTIATLATKNEQDKKKAEEAKAKAWAKDMEAASPFEFVDFPTKVIRDKGRRSGSAKLLPKSEEKGDRLPTNVKRNTEKDIHTIASESNSEDGKAPPGRRDEDHRSDDVLLEKRHNYALVCELQGMRDVHITRSCAASPRSYSCDRLGGLFKRHYDSYCDQHCACQYMNPNPMFKHGGSFGGL